MSTLLDRAALTPALLPLSPDDGVRLQASIDQGLETPAVLEELHRRGIIARRTAQQMPTDHLILTLPRLPSFATVGSNARKAHHMQAARAVAAEKAAWSPMLRIALGAGPRTPMTGDLSCVVTMVFKDRRYSDPMNMYEGVKRLIDLLQVPKVDRRGRQSGGFGVIVNDRQIVAPAIKVEVDKGRAPLTIVELRGA